MALTRKLLTALGIEADKIEQIIEAHTETVEALKKERDTYKEEAERLPDVEKELADLKKVKDGDATYKEQYEAEHKAFEDFKKEIEDKQIAEQKKAAYLDMLKKLGVLEKRRDLLLKLQDINALELDDKGALKNASALEKDVKDNYSDFIEKREQRGAEINNPPANNGGNGGNSYAANRAAQLQAQMYGAPAPKQ